VRDGIKKKILVIDDEEILTRTFTRLLEKVGYEVYAARNGQDAIAMMEEEAFDLVVCDMRMPGINGVDTVKAIRASGSGKNMNLPVIFVTGFADEATVAQAQQLKPLAYLYKPFDSFEILKFIKESVGA